jgi:hypothetical protein
MMNYLFKNIALIWMFSHISATVKGDSPLESPPAYPEIQVTSLPDESIISGGELVSLPQTAVGSSSRLIFGIRNTGTVTLTLVSFEIVGTDASEFVMARESTYPTLESGLGTTLSVRFEPKSSGIKNAMLSISSNDPDKSPFLIPLQGDAINAPAISVSVNFDDEPVNSYEFGEAFLGRPTKKITVRISNKGNLPLSNLTIQKSGAQASDFTVDSLGLATAVSAGTSSSFKVSFSPSATGYREALLQIHSNDPNGSPQVLNLSGVGLNGPRLTLSEGNEIGDMIRYQNGGAGPYFGYVRIVQGRAVKRLTVENVGNEPLRNIVISIAGINASEFFYNCQIPPSGLAPGESFTIYFGPEAWSPGNKYALLRISSNDPRDPVFEVISSAFAGIGENVIVNGDFSLADGTAGKGWAGGFLRSNTNPVLSGSGYYFFAGAVSSRTIYQNYQLTPEEIAYTRIRTIGTQSGTRYYLSADLFGYQDQRDYARVDVEFLGASGNLLGSGSLQGRSGRPQPWPFSISAGTAPSFQSRKDFLPAGTHSVRTTLRSYRLDGAKNCDGYADNIRLEIGRSGTEAMRGFEDWVKDAGLTGSDQAHNSTPHGDGVANLLKYAFNLDGTQADVTGLTPGSGTSGLPSITVVSGNGTIPAFLRFEFLFRRTNGLNYAPMVSDSLASGTFVPASSSRTFEPIDSEWERVVMLYPFDPAETPHLFGTIRVGIP